MAPSASAGTVRTRWRHLKANNSAGGPYYRIAAYTTAGLTSTITADMPFGGSNYNGLQMQLQRRLQKGLLLNAAYTFSRAMDDSTADFNSTALNPRRVQDFQNIRGDYSVVGPGSPSPADPGRGLR